jgi:3-methyl-2-oxobutanoate hydroxymethyltransferase
MRIKKIRNILKKKNKKPIVCLTAYSKNIAEILDNHCDIILVGDSLGSVLYGMHSTKNVSLDMMINHSISVKKGVKKSLLVVDMPFGTYKNKKIALNNARKILNKTKCDAVKLEGGKSIINIVKYLISHNISVMGHIGLLPQSHKGRFKFKGKAKKEKIKILEDAILLDKVGVFSIVIECIESNLAEKITKKVSVPTIGIGASKFCDGQILVTDDMLGLSQFNPRFVKKYLNLRKFIQKSIINFKYDVVQRKFPTKKYIY